MSVPTIIRDGSQSGADTVDDMHLEWSAWCDVGRLRETNEDAALALPGVYLLADGMGGHDCGELASEAALTTLAAVRSGEDQDGTQGTLEELLVDAQRAIGDIDGDSGRRAGTTTTGVVVVDHQNAPHWLAVNIGDSRTYLYRDGELEQLTIDHSQVQEFVDAGFLTPEQARVDPRRNVITRALGAGMVEPQPDFFSAPIVVGDTILVCSDGLTGELPDSEIAEILGDAATPADAAEALVDAALALGAHDNVTVIVVTATTTADGSDPAGSTSTGE